MRLFTRFVRSTTGKVALGIVVGTAISVPAAVFAVTSFSDVPTSHPFYKEISTVAGAGIAQGFNDGTYRPSDPITRQAMAAFMERGVGRAASANGTAFVAPGGRTEIAAVAMDAGATGGGTVGFVRVSGSISASSSVSTTAGCPCLIEVNLRDDNSSIANANLQVPLRADGQNALGTASIEVVVPIDGNSTHRYRLTTYGYLSGENLVVATGHITATYFPLSGDGDSTAAYELTCPKDDPWEDNDSSGSASAIYTDGSASAISCPTDDDWYSSVVPPGGTITAYLLSTSAQGDINMCLYREDNLTLEAVQISCSTGAADEEQVSDINNEYYGNYFVRVYMNADSGPPGNTYTLAVNLE